MATPMEVDATTGQAPVTSAGLGGNTTTNTGRSQRSPVMKCIYGCAINPSEKAIPLFCMHFICSDACAAKLKAKLTPENPLRCPLCELFIMSGELDRKIIPDSIFPKKYDNGDPNLRCQTCVWSHPAVAYCQDCPAFLCRRCEMQHPETIATMEHVITKELKERVQQQMEECSLSETKETKDICGDHGFLLTMFCENCDRKICPECNPTHQEHATFDVFTETKTLKAKINLARKLASVSESAIVDLRIKREQLLKAQWDDISTHITEQFKELVQVLLRSKEELQVQAREMFMRQLAEQNLRITSIEHAKCISDRFIANAEGVLQNGADISCIKFLREYQKLIEWLGNVDNKMSQDYDQFVQKGRHFKLHKEVSTKGALQNLLSDYCYLKYLDNYQPTNNPSMPTNHAPTRVYRDFKLQHQLPGSSGTTGNRSDAAINFDILPEAPLNSFEETRGEIEHACNLCNLGDNDDDSLQICCDECDKSFHLKCHAPAIRDIPLEERWTCNFHPTKDEVDQLISTLPECEGSEKWVLNESNPRHFQLACKFVMECYKIPGISTVRFFAAAYYEMFKKVPVSLKYIRERLTLSKSELGAFSGVEDMMLSFRQMFLQAFRYYGSQSSMELKRDVAKCFVAFMMLVQEYYPQYSQLFKDGIPV